MKNIIILIASFLLIILLGVGLIKDISNNSIYEVSGFERNQELMREEYFKKEIPQVYFRKIGYFYLNQGRTFINKTDLEAAKLFDVEKNTLIVISLFIFVILI